MLNEIKTQFYQILSQLNYTIVDNPYASKERTFPYIMLRLQDSKRDVYKNAYVYTIKFKIDIFSDYNGEAEILNMEDKIFSQSQKLYDNELITYVRQSGMRLIDDNSTGTLKKHGIIYYTILCTGGVENAETDTHP